MAAKRVASKPRLPVIVAPATEDDETLQRARAFSERLGLTLELKKPQRDQHLRLIVHRDQLALAESAASRQQPMHIDFMEGPTAYRRIAVRGKRELIARAIGDRARHRHVVDATAGLARDAFVLAVLGYQITALERSPVLAVMIEDAIARACAAPDEGLREAVARLHIRQADSLIYLQHLQAENRPEVIYLDPMYETSHGSALAKKEMRVLRKLVGDDPDAAELLRVARSVATKRVVVKRHRHAPALSEEPSHTIVGSRVRYDVYMVAH